MTYTGTLVELGLETVPIGLPLQFALRDEQGNLLANRGYVIKTKAELEKIISRGQGLTVDINESAVALRAYLLRLNKMVLQDNPLSDIAAAKLTADDLEAWSPATLKGGFPDFLAYQVRLAALLHRPARENFVLRLEQLQRELIFFVTKYPDACLASLVYLSARETQNYSALHALLVWAVVVITARQSLKWDPLIVESLGKAALTMNISMTGLQDQLALQKAPLDEWQWASIHTHAQDSQRQLQELGVEDPLWLDAVLHHGDRAPGPLTEKTMGQQLGRLIQRADVFAARLAPRINRNPLPVTMAMQASYLDETQQPDEAGSAMVMAMGIYAPGSFVKLATGEVAIVTRRQLVRPGVMGKHPVVAVVVNCNGLPAPVMKERDTHLSIYQIQGAVHASEVKVHIPLEKLVQLSYAA